MVDTIVAARNVTIKMTWPGAYAGGSGLRYTFDIASKQGKREVGVDAQTGAVLENKAEGPTPD